MLKHTLPAPVPTLAGIGLVLCKVRPQPPQSKTSHDMNGVQCTEAILVGSEASEDMSFVDSFPPIDSTSTELLTEMLGIMKNFCQNQNIKESVMAFGPFWLAVALLLSLAACSISGWGIKGMLTQFWEALFGAMWTTPTCQWVLVVRKRPPSFSIHHHSPPSVS